MRAPELVVGSVLLRPVTAADYDAILRWWNDPEVRRVHGLPLAPLGPSAVSGWYEALPEGAVAWIVDAEGEAIGTIELGALAGGRAELGVVIGDPGQRGRGVGRRICRRVCEWALGEGGYTAVELTVRTDNVRARRAFTAAGFTDAALLPRGVRRMRFRGALPTWEGTEVDLDFRQEAERLAPDLSRWRRHLHRHPELAFSETETAAYLTAELTAMGLAPRPVAGGIVADIEGSRPGACVALRADMDGLPITEDSGEPFSSATRGAMHACGHDCHMAGVLGAGRVLIAHRDALAGRVRLLFQPAEERPPGGAIQMIEAGALEGIDGIVGVHVQAQRPLGSVKLNRGVLTANSDRFEITVTGRGGHGSQPHTTTDVVLAASRIVGHIQSIVSRRVDPMQTIVITVGTLDSGSAANILPASAVLTGTIRTFDAAARATALAELARSVPEVGQTLGAESRFTLGAGYPSVLNPRHGITDVVWQAAEAVVGAGNVAEGPAQTGGEDFAHYQRVVPGVFLMVGAQTSGGGAHHSSQFKVDERCLSMGAAILAGSAWRLTADGVPPGRE